MIKPIYHLSENILDSHLEDLKSKVKKLEKEYCFGLKKIDTNEILQIGNPSVIIGLINDSDSSDKICTVCPPTPNLELSMLSPTEKQENGRILHYNSSRLLMQIGETKYEIRSRFDISDFL